jgi:hypothetical protein
MLENKGYIVTTSKRISERVKNLLADGNHSYELVAAHSFQWAKNVEPSDVEVPTVWLDTKSWGVATTMLGFVISSDAFAAVMEALDSEFEPAKQQFSFTIDSWEFHSHDLIRVKFRKMK